MCGETRGAAKAHEIVEMGWERQKARSSSDSRKKAAEQQRNGGQAVTRPPPHPQLRESPPKNAEHHNLDKLRVWRLAS